MALDPLKFKIAIKDEATSKIQQIESEFAKLKDKSITVNVSGLEDLRMLLSQLQHQQAGKIGKDAAKSISDAAKGLQEEAQKAVRASLGQLAQDLVAVKTAIQHDNFTAFSTRIATCAEAVNTLDAAFKQFHVTIGQDAGMKNFMTGLGEVIRNVRTTMTQLNGAGQTNATPESVYVRNVQRMEDALFRLQEARAKVSNAIKGAESAGMDSNIIGRWRIYLQVLDAYQKKLQNIKQDDTMMHGSGWQTNAFGTTFKHLLSNASDFEKAANVFIRAQEKLIAAKEKATGMNTGAAAQSGVSLFSGQNTEEIRKQIDAVGALYTQIQKLESELGRAGMAMQTISPTRWDELVRSGLYQKGVSYEVQMAKLRSEQIYPGDMKQQAEIIRENIERLRSLIAVFREGGYDVKGYEQQLNALMVTYEKFAALQPVDLGKKLGLEHVKGYTGPSAAANDVQWAAMKHQAEVQEVAGEAAKRHQRKLEELTNAFAQHDAQVAKSQRVQDGENKARQESAAALRKQAQELVKARMEMLRTQSADLGKLLSMGRGTLGSEHYDAVRNALRGVREEMRQIESVMQRMDSYSTRSLFSIGRGTTPDYAPLISSTQKLIAAKEQATQASNQMTAAEERLAHALSQTTEHAKGQSQVLSDLKSMATQYLGVWGGQQFLHNIIEIGGQLEMQRLSIGSILQNTAQANTLFEQIKGLAVKSPFGVVQLDQMTKQLTAYGFQYHELFDMTKRLADISAATGTDVSRLALALGHVRSEAALSGYTLRQFSMGNVPLLQKLSEKLGKTTKEIRNMVKGKEISYEDVLGVLKDLTNEGGMFYNMQEVISQSVKAKFKNVKDAMDIMYGEMAEGAPGDALKGVAEALMEIAKNWKDAATVLGTMGAIWGINRAAMLMYTKTLGASNVATMTAISRAQAQRAAQLELATTYRTLTAAEHAAIAASQRYTLAERARMYTGRKLTMEQKKRIVLARQDIIVANALALSSKRLTAEDIAKRVATGKLTASEARRIIVLSDLTAAEKAAAMSAVANVRTYGRLTGVINAASLAFGKLGQAMKAILLSPQMWIMAAITAIMELWQRNSQEMEKAKEISDQIYESSQEGLKNTRTMMQNTGIRVKWRRSEDEDWSDVTSNFGGQIGGASKMEKPRYDPSTAQQVIDEWTEYIRNYAATPNRILNDALYDSARNVRSLQEQFDKLYPSVIAVAQAYSHLQNMSGATEAAINATDDGLFFGWFEDNVVTDIVDYEKSLKTFRNGIAKTYADYRRNVDAGIKAARAQDKAFADATSGMATYAQAYEELIKNQDEYAKGVSAFKGAAGPAVSNAFVVSSSDYDGTADSVANSRREMESEMTSFLANYEAQLAIMGHSKEKISKDKSLQQAILIQMKSMLESAKVTKEVYDELMAKTKERFGIELDIKDEMFYQKKDAVTESLNNLVEGDWSVQLNFVENINDAIDEARKKYKQAKEFFEKTESIRLKFGIDLKMGQVMTDKDKQNILGRISDEGVRKEVEKVIDGLNQASAAFNQSTEASKKLGFSLKDPKEKKNSDKKKGDKKKGEHKTYKDPVAEEWKERIRLLKEANKLYEEWNKRGGRDAALKRVQDAYGDIFEQWRKDKNIPWKGFKAEDIVSYRNYVQKIADEAQDRYNRQRNDKGQNNGKEALAVLREAKNLLDELDKYDFDEKSKEFASNINKALSDLSSRWDIFESVRGILGDSDAAARMAAFTGEDFIWGANNKPRLKYQQSRAGSLQNYIDDLLLQNQFGDVVDFDKVMGMSEDQIEKYVKDFVNSNTPRLDGDTDESYQKRLELYQNKIEGITTLLKEWQKLQKDAVKSGTTEMAQLLADSRSVITAVGKIETEYQEAIQAAAMLRQQYQTESKSNPNGNPHGLNEQQYQQVVAFAESRREIGLKELTPQVQQFYNALTSLNRRTAQNIGRELLAAYKRAFDAGLFSADEYSEKVKKVLEGMTNANTLSTGSVYDRMARAGGWLFDRRSSENRESASIAAGSVRYRLADERANRTSADSDLLVNVLEGLEKALTNVAWGAGGRREVARAGRLGKAVQNWGNMTFEERALASQQALTGGQNRDKQTSFDQFTEDFEKGMEDFLDVLKKFQQGLEFASGFFDSLGMTDAANAAGDASNILGGAIQGASSLSSLGPYGMAAGAALGFVGGIAQTHDARLDRHISELREDVQKIENNTALIRQSRERAYGFDNAGWRDYAGQYAPRYLNLGSGLSLELSSKADRAMYEYYMSNSSGNGYQGELENLQKVREDQIGILNDQLSKKKKSEAEIEETKKKIVELDDQIRYFAEDLAKELFSIDLKGWADQIGDALMTAFENGTSSAQAFKDAASDIMRSVVSQMLKVGILQPMMAQLEERLFGENGAFDKSNPEASMGEVLAELGRFFGEGGEGQAMMGAAESFLTGAEDLLSSNYNMSLKSSSQSTQTSGIQSQATEETIGVLSGQMARIAQDVSVKRIFVTQLVTDQMPKILEHAQKQRILLERQFQSVRAIERAMIDGDGAMYKAIDRMSRKIDRAITPEGRMRVE